LSAGFPPLSGASTGSDAETPANATISLVPDRVKCLAHALLWVWAGGGTPRVFESGGTHRNHEGDAMDTTNPLCGLTAGDVMSDDRVTIPQKMPMTEAAQRLRRAEAASAPVVDDAGRYVGILSAEDFLRWNEGTGPSREGCHTSSCSFQTKGLVPGNPETVTCTLAEGSCILQVMSPTSGGRRVALCRDPHSYSCESQMPGLPPAGPAGGDEAGRYTAPHLTAGLLTPLPELARRMIETREQRVHIIDEDGRPVGVVLGTDLLALADFAPHCDRVSTP
jgi:CBS domain-containing protein